MKKQALKNPDSRQRSGIVLLVTLVLLVVLSTLGYTLSERVSSLRHRDRYMIDYQIARYGCDSAIKYALATLEDVNTMPRSRRQDEPDFSDVFALSEADYKEILDQWQQERAFHSNTSPYDIDDIKAKTP